jgi:hypothetical protein
LETVSARSIWLRYADRHLRHLFPYLPGQSGSNKRLRRTAGFIRHAIRAIATDTSVWSDDVWVVDSTPVECGRSRETVKRSALAALGVLRPLRQPFALGLGAAAAPGVHPPTACRWRWR